MRRLLADTRYEARSLIRRPGWTASAVLLLAIGIGANAAIFAALHKIILRPLPYEDADRMAYVWRMPQDRSSSLMITPTAALIDGFREQARSLEWIEAYQGLTFTILDAPEPTLADGARVSPALFAALGVRPLLGRPFGPADVEPGAEPVAMLSYGLWQRLYGGDPDIVDRVIRFEEGARTVVGVMPPDFPFLAPDTESELWVPLSHEEDGPATVLALALLREGVSVEQAEAELERVSAGMAGIDPSLAGWKPKLVRPNEMSSEDLRTAVLVLQGAVALVLLVAVGNVTNLLLARGLRRRQELTIRAALGAGRGQLARQLLIQGLILGSIGGALGLLLALWGIELIQWLRPESLELLDSLALHPGVLAFVAALTLVTGLGVGLVPAFRSTPVELAETMKQSGRHSSEAGQEWIRGALVGGQVAFCLLLLVGAGLLLRSFLHLAHRDPGFDPEGLLSVTVDLPRERYPNLADRAAFLDRLLEMVSAEPRVEIATVAAGLPPETGIMVGKMEIEGVDEAVVPDGSTIHALVRAGSDYFRALRIPVIAGRAFDASDREGAEPVAMIGERMAKEYFGGSEAVGQRIRFGGDTWYRIVGVAGDVRQQGLRSESHQVYFPVQQSRLGAEAVVLRTSEDPSALVGAVKAAVHAVDPRLPIRRISTAEELLAGSIARDRFLAALLAALSLTALALALIGVYGMVSYGVEQRVREIGIRVAVGANRRDVVRFILARGLWPVVAGLSLGLVGSLLGAQALRSLLYGVGPTDPVSLVLATSLLGLAVLGAHLYPVRRAVRLEPMAVLREE